MEIIKNELPVQDDWASRKFGRRNFLRYAGVTGASALVVGSLVLSACGKDEDDTGVNLGSGDTGILNYAYALEQLEAAPL